MPGLERQRSPEDIHARVVRGSRYPVLYRLGARVTVHFEEPTGKLVVTRGHGKIRLAYVIECGDSLFERARRGRAIVGHVVDVQHHPGGDTIRIQLGTGHS